MCRNVTGRWTSAPAAQKGVVTLLSPDLYGMQGVGDPERAARWPEAGEQGWQHRLGRPAILLQAAVVQGCYKPGARGAPLMPPPSAVHAADIEGEGEEKSLRDLYKPVR